MGSVAGGSTGVYRMSNTLHPSISIVISLLILSILPSILSINSPAGIRTMSLVSLGSCLFTINSSFAFLNGPMSWDASRVAAAIPSGVGFLGAGLIFKKEEKGHDGDSNHVVHGLTTAASVWLSAAVGIACGGDLFMAASFCVAIMLLLLRFGPRQHEHVDDGDYGDLGEEDNNDVIFDDKGLRRTELTRLTSSTSHAVGDLLAAASTSEILLPRIESSTDLDDPESVPNYASIHSHQHNDESMSLRSSTWGESGRAMTSSRRGSATTQKRRKNQAALGSIV